MEKERLKLSERQDAVDVWRRIDPNELKDRMKLTCWEGQTQTDVDATQGQIDDFFSQLPYKCHQNRVASVGD